MAAVTPATYPARPINGGPLELAPPKPGHWFYEPKYNGWRALVHAPTGAMFYRRGPALSIAGLFGSALKRLGAVLLLTDGIPVEWFDCEVLSRRHPLGRGALLVFDYLSPAGSCDQPLVRRKELLARALPEHDYTQPPRPEELYGVRPYDPATIKPQDLYRELKQLNALWGCMFYEGLVAKRTTDPY